MPQYSNSIVEKQFHRWSENREHMKAIMNAKAVPSPVITISRLYGSGGAEVASLLSTRLNCELVGIRIVDEIVLRSDVRKDLVDAMDEQVRSQILSWVDKIAGRCALNESEHCRYLLESLNYFMQTGSVVMLGRGAAFVPRIRPRLDVRIVASHQFRILKVMDRSRISYEEASLLVNQNDAHRARFVKRIFDRDWWDPGNYDMVVNMSHLSTETAVAVIEDAWMSYLRSMKSE